MRLLLAKDVTSEVLVLCLPENSMCPFDHIIACLYFANDCGISVVSDAFSRPRRN